MTTLSTAAKGRAGAVPTVKSFPPLLKTANAEEASFPLIVTMLSTAAKGRAGAVPTESSFPLPLKSAKAKVDSFLLTKIGRGLDAVRNEH